jgi:large repetitive protein
MRKFWRPKSSAGVPGSQPPGRGRRRIGPRAGAAALAITAALGLLTAVSSWGATAQAATLQVTTTSLPGAGNGVDYDVQLTAAGGTAPYTWTESGSLPPGFHLLTDGELQGSYAQLTSVTSTFTVQVTDSGSPAQTATQQLTLTAYGPPTITTSALPDATAGVAYSAQLMESDGDPPITWKLNGGPLPPGLTLSADGVVSGTPTEAGTFAFVPGVVDSASIPDAKQVTLTVNPAAPLTVTTASLPSATAGTDYSDQLTATGGVPPYTWSVGDTPLPPGIILVTDGMLSGTAPAAGTYTFTVELTDSATPVGTLTQAQLSLTVNPAAPPPLTVSTTSLPGGTAGTAYSQALSAAGGTTPYTWSVASGSLPAGLTLSAAGTISGTPKTAGTSTFTVKVGDAENPAQTATQQLSITVVADKADLAVAVTGPASAVPGGPVTDTITVTDKGPAAAGKVTVDLGTTGLAGVKSSAGGTTKSVTVLGVTLSATTWSLASLAPGQQVTYTVTGTVPAKGVKTASAAGLALSGTPDPNLLNNAGATSTKITG